MLLIYCLTCASLKCRTADDVDENTNNGENDIKYYICMVSNKILVMKTIILSSIFILSTFLANANLLRVTNYTDCDYFVAYNYTGSTSGGGTLTVPGGSDFTVPSPMGTNITSAKVFWVGNLYQCILVGFIYSSPIHSSSVPISPTCTPAGYWCSWLQPTITDNINLDIY